MLTARTIARKSHVIPFDIVVLASDQRHVRRKVLTLQHGNEVLVDLAIAVSLNHGDRLVLDDGRHIEVIAGEERLIEARAARGEAIATLAWHIGNRHLPAQIEAERILIGFDHVIRDMLVGLGAEVREVVEPFHPVRGAYSHATPGHHHGHSHDHSHGHVNAHDYSHSHGKR